MAKNKILVRSYKIATKTQTAQEEQYLRSKVTFYLCKIGAAAVEATHWWHVLLPVELNSRIWLLQILNWRFIWVCWRTKWEGLCSWTEWDVESLMLRGFFCCLCVCLCECECGWRQCRFGQGWCVTPCIKGSFLSCSQSFTHSKTQLDIR